MIRHLMELEFYRLFLLGGSMVGLLMNLICHMLIRTGMRRIPRKTMACATAAMLKSITLLESIPLAGACSYFTLRYVISDPQPSTTGTGTYMFLLVVFTILILGLLLPGIAGAVLVNEHGDDNLREMRER